MHYVMIYEGTKIVDDGIFTRVMTACEEEINLEDSGDHVDQMPIEHFDLTYDRRLVTCPKCKETL